MRNRAITRLVIVTIASVWLLPGSAYADTLKNDVAGGSKTINAGENLTVGYTIAPSKVQGKDVCSVSTTNPANVTVSPPTGVTADKSSLQFTNCTTTQVVTYTSKTPGTYTVNVSISGATVANNATFTLTVKNTNPVLTVPGDMTVEGNTTGGAIVTYSVSATDVTDSTAAGTLTIVCDPASGTLFSLGVQIVKCTATDSNGGTDSKTFKVTVVDTTGPVFSTVANVTAEATGPTGATVNYVTPTATDVVSGSRDVTCLPASGSLFPLGETTVECTATDAEKNSSQTTFKVIVQDTTPPQLSGVPSDMTVEATGPSGATVTYAQPTATDLVDGPVSVTCLPAPGTFSLGQTTVTCSATDKAGNEAKQTFKVTVQDTTGPQFSGVPSNMFASAKKGSAVVSFSLPTAADLVDGDVPVECDPPAGSTFPVGETTVTCTAVDQFGNRSTATFKVTVQEEAEQTDPGSHGGSGTNSEHWGLVTCSSAESCSIVFDIETGDTGDGGDGGDGDRSGDVKGANGIGGSGGDGGAGGSGGGNGGEGGAGGAAGGDGDYAGSTLGDGDGGGGEGGTGGNGACENAAAASSSPAPTPTPTPSQTAGDASGCSGGEGAAGASGGSGSGGTAVSGDGGDGGDGGQSAPSATTTIPE